MTKIRKAITIIYRRVWILIKRAVGKRIKCDGRCLLSPHADVQIDRFARLCIGRYVTVEKNGLIAVRKDGIVIIKDGVYCNRNCIIVAHKKIEIGKGVTIGPNCCFFDHDHDLNKKGSFVSSPIIIENNVWIGANTVILKGVTIGENAVIAAGSIITKSIPSNAIVIQKRDNTYKDLSTSI